MKFTKSHALGNDYILLEERELPFEINARRVKLLCDRHIGIGSDGILLLTESGQADFGMRILNPDGSEAEKSGNGLRMFAKYLYEHGHTDKDSFTIGTAGGTVFARLRVKNGKISEISVEMGKVTFNSKEIPVEGEERKVVSEKLKVDDKEFTITCVSIGNPHCVIFVDRLDEAEVRKYGPLIENHSMFPNRTNVQFAKVNSKTEVSIMIWERGAGETLASGSSACAVAAAAVKNKLTDTDLTVKMHGGELKISIDSHWNTIMSGTADEVYTGELSENFLNSLN